MRRVGRTGCEYTKDGLSGISAFWCFIQVRAFSVMSVMKWKFGSFGSSTRAVPS